MASPSYRAGVAWIALNDEPTELDVEAIAGFISTLLLADLFGKEPADVARAIRSFRLVEREVPGAIRGAAPAGPRR